MYRHDALAEKAILDFLGKEVEFSFVINPGVADGKISLRFKDNSKLSIRFEADRDGGREYKNPTEALKATNKTIASNIFYMMFGILKDHVKEGTK